MRGGVALLLCAALGACEKDRVVVDDQLTGIELTTTFDADTLRIDQLAVAGVGEDGTAAFASGKLPRTPRRLSGRETAVILIPDQLGGRSIVVRVDGLDRGTVVGSAAVAVSVVPRVIVPVRATLGAAAICGDGVLVAEVERCDDGNTDGGDGCAATCFTEPPYVCSGAPSACAPCGDAICSSGVEDQCSCDADCDGAACGDGSCCLNAGENRCTCPEDCGANTCGDGVCCHDGTPGGETACNCEADCRAQPDDCGDGCCTGAETTSSCNTDC